MYNEFEKNITMERDPVRQNRMWQKKESKLELAASMIRQVMPEFHSRDRVARSKLMGKIDLFDIDEYNMLKENRQQNEVRSLELLDEFYKSILKADSNR